ncbi:hypothetical protein NAV26_08255 [Pseudomonas stutzeri]|uniref:coiled-coil domain-containing protein n=1 Tax=Stutzerimonas stutzeri TaxID=316 RepID=UPI0011AF1CEE|nr:hypothetical protein [Stutzerimonas stutzeri]MCQ4324955.1 hypothetical protein [Stutzerimonas stutzeri]
MNVKNTTMIWKRMNYSGQQTRVNKTAGLAQLRSSLSHSLRTVKKGELEFNEQLSKHNRIVYQGKIIALDSLSIDERKAIVNDIVSSVSADVNAHQDITKFKNDRSKYVSKLKTLVKKDNEPDELKRLIQSVLDESGAIDLSIVNTLDEMSLKRVNDKKSALTNYIELHNKIVNSADDLAHKKKTVIQESFFKFPSRNNISEVKPEDYLKIIHSFHRQYLPDYEIKACVFHGDEVLSKDDMKNGVHPHIFISGKNSKTGQYDLVNAQLQVVNQHLKNTNRPELKNDSFQSAQKIGEAYQELVYQFVNKKLKEYGYLIEAAVSEKTIEHKQKIANIKKEQNKAKVSRSYNLLNHTLDEISKAEAEKKKLEIENKRKAEELELKKKQFNSVIKRMNERNDQFKKLEADININNGILANTNKEIVKQSKIKDDLVESNKSLHDEQNRLKSLIKKENKELDVLRSRIASEQKELSFQIEQNDKLNQSNKSLLKQIQENEIKRQKVEDYDLKLNLLSFNIHDRRKIESSLKEFNKANYALLKEMSPKERDEFLMGQQERFKRESIDTVVDTSLSTTQKVGLFFNDVKRRIIKPGS